MKTAKDHETNCRSNLVNHDEHCEERHFNFKTTLALTLADTVTDSDDFGGKSSAIALLSAHTQYRSVTLLPVLECPTFVHDCFVTALTRVLGRLPKQWAKRCSFLEVISVTVINGWYTH
eukprot:scpid51117/ scgid25491/ 